MAGEWVVDGGGGGGLNRPKCLPGLKMRSKTCSSNKLCGPIKGEMMTRDIALPLRAVRPTPLQGASLRHPLSLRVAAWPAWQ